MHFGFLRIDLILNRENPDVKSMTIYHASTTIVQDRLGEEALQSVTKLLEVLIASKVSSTSSLSRENTLHQ